MLKKPIANPPFPRSWGTTTAVEKSGESCLLLARVEGNRISGRPLGRQDKVLVCCAACWCELGQDSKTALLQISGSLIGTGQT